MNAPPRVVFVDHSSERGGAELALVRLLRTSQDWHASIIVPDARDADADAFAALPESVEVTRSGPRHSARKASRGGRLGAAALTVRIIGSAIGLISTRTARRADVIVANTTRASVYVALACAVLRKPFAVHIRDMVDVEGIGAAATALMRRVVLPRAAAVIANSTSSRLTVERYLSSECVQAVLPSPAGLEVVEQAAVSVAHEVSRIGMVARLDPWKGHELLIEAFATAFAGRRDSPTLVLFGGPSFGHQDFADKLISRAEQLGVGPKVEIAGHVSDVRRALESLDICVQCSSRPEPLGQNVLQYLAAGKPSIVSNEGGPSEWVTNGVNGLTFTARDRNSLAETIARLTDDRQLRVDVARAAVLTPGLLSDHEVSSEVRSIVTRIARNRL